MANKTLTQSRLKELLHYDPDTGVFTWRTNRSHIRIGDMAGAAHNRGYWQIQVDGRIYLAHRLAWMYVHGAFPIAGTDHINGVRHDNRIANLREATQAENHQNRSKQSNNNSGFIGVYWDSKRDKWCADIQAGKKRIRLGRFDAPESAHAAYLTAKAKLHTFNPTVRADD